MPDQFLDAQYSLVADQILIEMQSKQREMDGAHDEIEEAGAEGGIFALRDVANRIGALLDAGHRQAFLKRAGL